MKSSYCDERYRLLLYNTLAEKHTRLKIPIYFHIHIQQASLENVFTDPISYNPIPCSKMCKKYA